MGLWCCTMNYCHPHRTAWWFPLHAGALSDFFSLRDSIEKWNILLSKWRYTLRGISSHWSCIYCSNFFLSGATLQTSEGGHAHEVPVRPLTGSRNVIRKPNTLEWTHVGFGEWRGKVFQKTKLKREYTLSLCPSFFPHPPLCSPPSLHLLNLLLPFFLLCFIPFSSPLFQLYPPSFSPFSVPTASSLRPTSKNYSSSYLWVQ